MTCVLIHDMSTIVGIFAQCNIIYSGISTESLEQRLNFTYGKQVWTSMIAVFKRFCEIKLGYLNKKSYSYLFL